MQLTESLVKSRFFLSKTKNPQSFIPQGGEALGFCGASVRFVASTHCVLWNHAVGDAATVLIDVPKVKKGIPPLAVNLYGPHTHSVLT